MYHDSKLPDDSVAADHHPVARCGHPSAYARLAVLGLLGLVAAPVHGELILGSPFGDSMVLQQGMALPIWGWAEAGAEVTVSIADQQHTAVADATGRWQVTLSPLPSGGPHEMVIAGPGEARLTDVLVGEVWLASGQSNMVMRLREVASAEDEIAAADYPQLRLIEMPLQRAGLPQVRSAKPARWVAASPQTAGAFSAVGYFFARDLHDELKVPVGIIVVAANATAIEPWVPREGVARVARLQQWYEDARAADEQYVQAITEHEYAVQAAIAKGEQPPAAPEHPYAAKDEPHRNLGMLFNGSVAPVVGYGIRGMIWYQGESNRGDTGRYYHDFMQALAHGWRAEWKQGDFPIYYVQISALSGWRPDWHIPEIWEGQLMSLSIPNTGMAVIHDLLSDITKIHPREKRDVGKRLALWALAKDYGRSDLAYSGPLYRDYTIENDRIRITFDHTFGGLKSRDGQPLNWFTIAGEDGNFVEAQASIDGDTVVVWSDQVPAPKAVNLGWHEAAQPNLVNEANLPASPFRTHRPD